METRREGPSWLPERRRALVGIAHTKGAIPTIDQPAAHRSFSGVSENCVAPRSADVSRWRMPLSIASGFEWNEDVPYTDPRNDEIRRMNRNPQPLRFVLTRPFAGDPGSTFKYNGGLAQAMAAVKQRATKTPFLGPRGPSCLSRLASPMSSQSGRFSATMPIGAAGSGCARVISAEFVHCT